MKYLETDDEKLKFSFSPKNSWDSTSLTPIIG